MNPKQQYLALTIGPIYRTLTAVKSTKAIWAASYLFSHLMHTVLRAIKDQPGLNILMPYTGDLGDKTEVINLFEEKFTKDFGLFPDRLIAESIAPQRDYDSLKNAIDTARMNLVDYLFADLKNESKDAQGVFEKLRPRLTKQDLTVFVQSYFQLSLLQFELGAEDIAKDSNPVFEINALLDTVELQQQFPTVVSVNYLKYFLEDIFYNTLVQKGSSLERFPSTIEISTSGLSKISEKAKEYRIAARLLVSKDKAENQEGFLQELRGANFELLQHHKYIAIVVADGDNMGKLISEIYAFDPGLFELFSKQLLRFAYAAALLVKKSGAYPIYTGGDDLLFFSPIDGLDISSGIETKHSTIFHLIGKIDELFEQYIGSHATFQDLFDRMEKNAVEKNTVFQKPSMSYGLSISYYKHPLNEALQKGYELLFQTAKNTKSKNTVAFSLQKHSGQSFGASISKNTRSYQDFVRLQDRAVLGSERFFTSITHRLFDHRATLYWIYDHLRDETLQLQHLSNFFENNFDEAIHRDNSKYLDEIKHLMHHFFIDINAERKDNQLEQLYALIRFIQFLKTEYKND